MVLEDFPQHLIDRVKAQPIFRYKNYRDMFLLALKGAYYAADESVKKDYEKQAYEFDTMSEIWKLLNPNKL